MATGDNLNNISAWKELHAKLSGNARAQSNTAMSAFSLTINQAGMRRAEEAKKMYKKGMAAAAYFVADRTGINPFMHGVLMEMSIQAKNAIEKFGSAAERHNLPSVDTKGKPIPPPSDEPGEKTDPGKDGSKLPFILAGVAVAALAGFFAWKLM